MRSCEFLEINSFGNFTIHGVGAVGKWIAFFCSCLTAVPSAYRINRMGSIEKLLTRHWTVFSAIMLAFFAVWTAGTAAIARPVIKDEAQEPRPGFFAPDFELLTPEGSSIRLSDLRGRPVILNLWASWCPPCKAEMPALENVHQQYEVDGLVVLGVNMTYQDSAQSAIQFLSDGGLTFPVVMDTDGSVGRRYQMRALPTTFFIDRNGKIHSLEIGGPLPEALLRSKAILLLGAD
jgi:cytochrome c biogenesis protein CcmG, thiol:disulfide interchange protein DsbE